MISFFKTEQGTVIAVESNNNPEKNTIRALEWLFGNAKIIGVEESALLSGRFIGPRKEMITPWSTTAVEITQNMNISGIKRIEEFFPVSKKGVNESEEPLYDKMLQRLYNGLDGNVFTINRKPEPVIYIKDLKEYNESEGLALNEEEMDYLQGLSKKLCRPLTDSEVFGFSQVNSEHCRHKIVNGTFIIDGTAMSTSLFRLIKKTSLTNPNLIVSAYKDNCAFLEGDRIKMFHPADQTRQ